MHQKERGDSNCKYSYFKDPENQTKMKLFFFTSCPILLLTHPGQVKEQQAGQSHDTTQLQGVLFTLSAVLHGSLALPYWQPG